MKGLTAEFFIAQRIALSARGGKKNVMLRVAWLTVAVSMVVMILALAVIFGFRDEISSKLVGFGGHVKIVNLDGNNSFETAPILLDAQLEESVRGVKNFKHIAPYVVKGGIFKSETAMQGVMLKGIDRSYDMSFYQQILADGALPAVGDSVRNKDVLISRSLARLMGVGVGDKVEMLFVGEGVAPRRDRFKISGIYDSQFEELDKLVLLTDIRNVRRLNRWAPDQITGYEITTTNFSDLEPFTADVHDQVMDNGAQSLMTVNIKESYPMLFDWLQAHNVNALVVIVIMILVSLFNMISALLIILLERTSMIGLLKALGMRGRSLRRLFLMRSAFIVLKGMFWGNLVGLAICFAQKYTGFIKLDPTGYFLSAVPIEISVGWIVILNISAFAVILSLLAIPTMIISYIKPDVTLRYQ